MRELLRKNRLKNSAVYLQITRGRAKRDFKFPANDTRPSLMIMTPHFDFDNNQAMTNGIKIKTVKDIRWEKARYQIDFVVAAIFGEAGSG